MTRALPNYLSRHASFDDCPPGHRFGLYFDAWNDDWSVPEGKAASFKKVAEAFPTHSRKALEAIQLRQAEHAKQLGEFVFSHPARLSAPLATGLGNEHPLENGFAFLTPHGLPYLAGSGVKGVLRRAAEELASENWGESCGWDQASIDVLFGLETESGDTESARTRGALVFWDLYFQPRGNRKALAVEIMTPHHREYLQGKGRPHANELPNPIPFLAIPAGSECTLYVQCNPSLIPSEATALRKHWMELLAAAVEHASEWLGFGAKTAVGYGRLEIDPKAQRALQEKREAAEAKRREQEAEAALATAPADRQLLGRLDQALAALPIDPRTDKPIVQATSGKDWAPALALLNSQIAALADIAKPEREKLAVEVKARLNEHFKVEGKAEKAMKQVLAAIRGS